MFRKAPGSIRLKQMVLQYEVLRILPVVRDLALVVIAHHVGHSIALCTAGRIRILTFEPPLMDSADKAVHLAAVNVGCGARGSVRPAEINVLWVIEGLNTLIGFRIGPPYTQFPCLHRN